MFKYLLLSLVVVSIYGKVPILKCKDDGDEKEDSEDIKILRVNECDGNTCIYEIRKGYNALFDFNFNSRADFDENNKPDLKVLVHIYDKIIQFPQTDSNLCNADNKNGHIKPLNTSNTDICKGSKGEDYRVKFEFLIPLLTPTAEIDIELLIENGIEKLACGVFHSSFID